MVKGMSINAGTTVCCGMWPQIQSRKPFHVGTGSRVIQLRASFEKERNIDRQEARISLSVFWCREFCPEDTRGPESHASEL